MTRVLIVDDDQTTLASIARAFKMAGYDAVVCDNAMRAITLLRTERFDLVFSDVVMPGGMTGDVLAEEISRLRPGVKLLYTSGYADEGIARRGMFEGVFLEKPFTPSALLKKVREALDS